MSYEEYVNWWAAGMSKLAENSYTRSEMVKSNDRAKYNQASLAMAYLVGTTKSYFICECGEVVRLTKPGKTVKCKCGRLYFLIGDQSVLWDYYDR